jgi:ATP-binding cassette, subfamily B, bacterial PglK
MKKLLAILTKKQKINFAFLSIGMFVSMLFEMLGLSLVIPLAYGLVEKSIFEKFAFLRDIQELLNYPDNEAIIFLSLSFFLAIYIFKNIYLIFFHWFEGKFIFSTKENVSSRLFKNYLYKDYFFHTNENSANLVTRLKDDLRLFAGYLEAFSTLITEIFFFIGLTIFLLLIQVTGIFLISLFVVFALTIFYLFFYKKIKYLGNERQEIETYRSKKLQEGIAGIKEIKSFGIENFFSEKYSTYSTKLSKNNYLYYVIQKTPKLYFEIIALSAIVLFCYYLIIINTDLEIVLATLGIVIAASLRLIPSANRFLHSYNSLKYGSASINSIHSEIKLKTKIDISEKQNRKVEFKKNINFNTISFKYQNREDYVFKNVNLEILKGEKVAITGSSGSGKSTFLDLMMGFHDSVSGQISVDNNNIPLNSQSWRKLIGYVPQSIYLFDDTILENITLDFDKKNLDKKYFNQCIKTAELTSMVDSLPEKINAIVGEGGVKISGGQKQRIGIARALFKKPSILILDEATNALDKDMEVKIVNNLINNLNDVTIIMVTHKLDLIKNFNKIITIEDNKIKIKK